MIDKEKRVLILQVLLFLLTIVTTTAAGFELVNSKSLFFGPENVPITTQDIQNALSYSLTFLFILTVHEMGHFITSHYYGVKTSWPYFIPFYFPLFPSIGTLGAFIRIKEALRSRIQVFDVGLAGPLAGFIVALIVLVYGFTHLPPAEYIFSIHPEYQKYGLDYAQYVYKNVGGFYLGDSPLLFRFLEYLVSDRLSIPNQYEMMHYPFLLSGYLACFFTALNLLPMGQLDGGHILYGLAGFKNHKRISTVLFIGFVFYAGVGLVTPAKLAQGFDTWVVLYFIFLYYSFLKIGKTPKTTFLIALSVFTAQFALAYIIPTIKGYNGWLLFAFIIGRMLGVEHPPVADEAPLDLKRKILGWVSLCIFILCFTPAPFVMD